MEEFNIVFTFDGYSCYGHDSLVKEFNENPIGSLFEYLKKEQKRDNVGLNYLLLIIKTFLTESSKCSELSLDRNFPIPLTDSIMKQLLSSIPLCEGDSFIDESWLRNEWNATNEWLHTSLNQYKGSVESFLFLYSPSLNVYGRTYFHLVETKEEFYPFAFLTSYATKVNGSVKHMPLSYALKEYNNDQKQILHLLTTIMKASKRSPFISNLIEKGELFNPTYLSVEEAYELLKLVPYFEECGIGIRFPSWWTQKHKVYSSLSTKNADMGILGLEGLIHVELDFVLDGVSLTKEEIEALLKLDDGLRQFKGNWIEIDHQYLEKMLEQFNAYKEEFGGGLTFKEFLKLQREEARGSEELDGLVLEMGDFITSFKEHTLFEKRKVPLPATFKGALRPYQRAGTDWLYNMISNGFGCCLADDMGLGKTIQILAMLTSMFEKNLLTNVLLAVPSSLMGNWQNEIEKFAPTLPFTLLDQSEAKMQKLNLQEQGLFITTYKRASNRACIQTTQWDLVILDESQAIKNPGTKQSKSIKALTTRGRIAMTGTPVENSLTDLWSLFDFINPGLLGTKREFDSAAKQMMANDNGYQALRNVIDPFILRRLKTDKTVIKDLPEKIETDIPVALSSTQIVLYKKLVKSMEETMEQKEGIERKGLVLSLILKSKQICNHPSLYLGMGDYREKDSGKFLALKQIVSTIRAKHERMLVFTQYRSMIAPLESYLENLFGYKGLTIDGSVGAKQRTERVNLFNGKEYIPFMVITIKAGGTGLNLTSANHVVHFDRWWNPAVEDQATDRVFRIGQKKTVNVYKFTCIGTIEDKINTLIMSKKALSDSLITDEKSTVSWILNNDDSAMKKLFEYSVK